MYDLGMPHLLSLHPQGKRVQRPTTFSPVKRPFPLVCSTLCSTSSKVPRGSCGCSVFSALRPPLGQGCTRPCSAPLLQDCCAPQAFREGRGHEGNYGKTRKLPHLTVGHQVPWKCIRLSTSEGPFFS